MRVSESQWKKARQQLKRYEDIPSVATQLGMRHETLISIWAQKQQELNKKSHLKHKKNAQLYVDRYRGGISLLRIAEDEGMSPAQLVRLVVPMVCGEEWKGDKLKDVDWDRVGDARLQTCVRECLSADTVCSPMADRVRAAIGAEYEFKMVQMLSVHKVQFKTEEVLQQQGFAKTPDVYFSIPHRVLFAEDEQPVFVTWMDSKATFGDAYQVRSYSNQFLSYRQRFGPGIVVFWFGYIDGLQEEWRKKGVYLVHSFPQRIELSVE